MGSISVFKKTIFVTELKKRKMSILTIILNIFLPPLSVALNNGIGKDFIINIILTLLGGIPGMIHAFYVTSR